MFSQKKDTDATENKKCSEKKWFGRKCIGKIQFFVKRFQQYMPIQERETLCDVSLVRRVRAVRKVKL